MDDIRQLGQRNILRQMGMNIVINLLPLLCGKAPASWPQSHGHALRAAANQSHR